jgi:hypothetical protein
MCVPIEIGEERRGVEWSGRKCTIRVNAGCFQDEDEDEDEDQDDLSGRLLIFHARTQTRRRK